MKKIFVFLLCLMLLGGAFAEGSQIPWGQSDLELIDVTTEGSTVFLNGCEIESYEYIWETDDVLSVSAVVNYSIINNWTFYRNMFVGNFYECVGGEAPYIQDIYPFSFDELNAQLTDGGNERIFALLQVLRPYSYSSAEAISGCKFAELEGGMVAGSFPTGRFGINTMYFIVNEAMVLGTDVGAIDTSLMPWGASSEDFRASIGLHNYDAYKPNDHVKLYWEFGAPSSDATWIFANDQLVGEMHQYDPSTDVASIFANLYGEPIPGGEERISAIASAIRTAPVSVESIISSAYVELPDGSVAFMYQDSSNYINVLLVHEALLLAAQ